MEKLKSFASNMHFPSSSTAGNKLSKAFRFDKDLNVLRRTETGDPFQDGPTLEEPSLSRSRLILHCCSLFFTFLAICTMGGVAGFQAKWFSVSGGTGFTIFLLVITFVLSTFLLVTPLVYDRWDKMKRPAKFLAEPRSTLILHAFGSLLMIIASLIVTISAWTAKGCKDSDNDPHASLGDSYKKGLGQWCTTKKASAIFDWLSFGCFLALLVLAGLEFRRDRRRSHREPGFIPPTSPNMTYGAGAGISPASYAQVQPDTDRDHDGEHEDKYEQDNLQAQYDRPQAQRPQRQSYYPVQQAPTGSAMSRPSMDAYGAFDGDMPGNQAQAGAGQTSRTMEMAYTDPYAQIRASLMSEPVSGGYALPQAQPGYSMPQPPTYQYR